MGDGRKTKQGLEVEASSSNSCRGPGRIIILATAFFRPRGSRIASPLTAGGDYRLHEMLARAPMDSGEIYLVSSSVGLLDLTAGLGTPLHLVSVDSTFREFPKWRPLALIVQVLRGLLAAVWIVRNRSPTGITILYSSSTLPSDVIASAMARLICPSTRWVAVVHHTVQGRKGLARHNAAEVFAALFEGLVVILTGGLADTIIAISGEAHKSLSRFRRDSQPILSGLNGLDIQEIAAAGAAQLTHRPNSVIYVGRMSSQKGLSDLLGVWQVLSQRMPQTQFTLVGAADTMSRGDLRKEIAERGLDGVVSVKGVLARKDVLRLIVESSVFTTTSLAEGWSIAIMESLALGTPVVAWDLPELRHVYSEGITAVPLGSVSSFADAVERLLSNPQEQRRLGEAGRQTVAPYSWERAASAEWSILQDLSAKFRPPDDEQSSPPGVSYTGETLMLHGRPPRGG